MSRCCLAYASILIVKLIVKGTIVKGTNKQLRAKELTSISNFHFPLFFSNRGQSIILSLFLGLQQQIRKFLYLGPRSGQTGISLAGQELDTGRT